MMSCGWRSCYLMAVIYLAPFLLQQGEALPLSSSSDFDDSALLGPSAASSGSSADDINVTPATTDEKQEMVDLLQNLAHVISYEDEMRADDLVGRALLPQVGEFIAALGKLFGSLLGTTTAAPTTTTPKTG